MFEAISYKLYWELHYLSEGKWYAFPNSHIEIFKNTCNKGVSKNDAWMDQVSVTSDNGSDNHYVMLAVKWSRTLIIKLLLKTLHAYYIQISDILVSRSDTISVTHIVKVFKNACNKEVSKKKNSYRQKILFKYIYTNTPKSIMGSPLPLQNGCYYPITWVSVRTFPEILMCTCYCFAW